MPELSYPPKPRPGDRVAGLSRSAGLPAIFPEVYELGPRRLRDVLGLESVEHLTTRKMGADPAERARDIHAAFADPGTAAVLASIGGDDQLTVLPHLDGDLLRAHPKPFSGHSDNTDLLNHLLGLGLVGHHGPCAIWASGASWAGSRRSWSARPRRGIRTGAIRPRSSVPAWRRSARWSARR